MPNRDRKSLYMRTEPGHHMESTLFLARDLRNFRDRWPLLLQTTPYLATLTPGDTLYIPHRWLHEVWSSNRSIAFSSWVRDG